MRPAYVTNAVGRLLDHAKIAGEVEPFADACVLTRYIAQLEREIDAHRCSARGWLRSMLHPSEKRRRDDVADRQALAARVPRFADDPYSGEKVDITGAIGRETGDKAAVSFFHDLFWVLFLAFSAVTFALLIGTTPV